MSTEVVPVASSAADAQAVDAVRNHHAEIAGRIAILTDTLIDAAAAGGDVETARRAAVDYLNGTLMPHAVAEERKLYPAAGRRDDARLLVESMIAVHRVLAGLVDRIATEPSPVRLAAAAYALRVVFDAHLVDENDRILPLIAADPGESLTAILDGMHELLGGHEESEELTEAGAHSGGHFCGCGEKDDEHRGPDTWGVKLNRTRGLTCG
ncbi:hemerythrin domain-containing protein [Rhodococcus sp. SJ-3]|uniref:hemerythrin domain-containing protein n=1 Tax=Rhodococcus sp. SJ-3 TaxID=3454628 RepID=UPI003F7941AA